MKWLLGQLRMCCCLKIITNVILLVQIMRVWLTLGSNSDVACPTVTNGKCRLTHVWSHRKKIFVCLFVFLVTFHQFPVSALYVMLVILLWASLKITLAFLNVFGNLATVVKCLLLTLPMDALFLSLHSHLVLMYVWAIRQKIDTKPHVSFQWNIMFY